MRDECTVGRATCGGVGSWVKETVVGGALDKADGDRFMWEARMVFIWGAGATLGWGAVCSLGGGGGEVTIGGGGGGGGGGDFSWGELRK